MDCIAGCIGDHDVDIGADSTYLVTVVDDYDIEKTVGCNCADLAGGDGFGYIAGAACSYSVCVADLCVMTQMWKLDEKRCT